MSHLGRVAIPVALVLLCWAWLGTAFAAGFQVSETSVSGLGRAFAGAGISGDGPSDLFHNPAGLTLREARELELGAYRIVPNAGYQDRGSTLPDGRSGSDANGGVDAWVPNFYYAAALGANHRYGIGITSPFGLTTEYAADWVGRYHALKSELATLELNPVIALRVRDGVSIGYGLTLLRAEAELSQAVPFTGQADGRATVKGDATAMGFTLGVMLGGENRRLGLGYRSSVNIDVDGELTVVAPGRSMPPVSARATITLPATAYLSGFAKITDRVELLGTLRWTDWSEFSELRVDFDDRPPSVTSENWVDANTYSIGFNYRHGDRWIFRGGYAKDESPIPNADSRTPRIPDAERDWLTLGVSYRTARGARLDFSFAHLFTAAVAVRQMVPTRAGPAHLDGVYGNTEANIFGVQLHLELER